MHRHLAITYCYHLLAEAIIAFLILIPFTFDYYDTSHYLGYIFVIVITGICFYFLEINNRSYIFFVILIPFISLLLFLLQFPIGLAVIFPLLFVWRYANIRSYKLIQNEKQSLRDKASTNKGKLYLQLTMGIAVIVVIYSKEIFVITYVLLQFIILLTGYLLSNIAVMDKKDRKQVRVNTFFLAPVILLLGSLFAFYFFDPFRVVMYNIWIGFRTLIIFIVSNIVALIGFIIPIEKPEITEDQEEMMILMQQMQDEEDPWKALLPDGHKPGISEEVLVIVTTCIIIAIISYLMIRAIKTKRQKPEVKVQSVTHHSLDKEKSNKKGFISRLFQRTSKKPTHPVRNLVYEFEREAVKNDFGRYPFESIDEWFRRLRVNVRIETYEKVRYGDMEVSQQEIDQLKQQLSTVNFKKLEIQEDM